MKSRGLVSREKNFKLHKSVLKVAKHQFARKLPSVKKRVGHELMAQALFSSVTWTHFKNQIYVLLRSGQ
jgi:hypothetical protein